MFRGLYVHSSSRLYPVHPQHVPIFCFAETSRSNELWYRPKRVLLTFSKRNKIKLHRKILLVFWRSSRSWSCHQSRLTESNCSLSTWPRSGRRVTSHTAAGRSTSGCAYATIATLADTTVAYITRLPSRCHSGNILKQNNFDHCFSCSHISDDLSGNLLENKNQSSTKYSRINFLCFQSFFFRNIYVSFVWTKIDF